MVAAEHSMMSLRMSSLPGWEELPPRRPSGQHGEAARPNGDLAM
jgi:hypothetical protein